MGGIRHWASGIGRIGASPLLLLCALCVHLPGCLAGHESPPQVAAQCRVITARDFAVLRVIDGDTFAIMYDGEPTSCRLFGVDAPERGEPGFGDARDELARLIDEGGGVVTIDFPAKRKRDNFGRLLVTATAVGRDLGAELVRRGLAREDRRR